MYLSKYASTQQTTNLARVARMTLGPCTDVLRAVLTNEIPPLALSQNVKTFIANHPKHRKCPINTEQEKLIHGKIYDNFDISLLYTVLRNICRIPEHKNGWGNVPSPTDRSVSANIERIRLIRNEYGHKSELSVSDTEFKRKWQDILKIVKELERSLSSSTVFETAVIDISTCSMDPEQESKYIKRLPDLDKKIQDISEETKRVENTCVPKNVRVLYERDVSRWKKDDSLFVETHNFPAILDQVRKQTHVTFVGVPGSGKTATARHIALTLEKEGYQILPIKDIKDIETFCDPDNPQVFIINDVLGVFGLDKAEFNKLKKYQDRIKDPTMSETKTLMTCREAVFKNDIVSKAHFMSQEKHIVQFSDDSNALTTEDRRKLLVKYNLEAYVLLVQKLPETSKMFPILCKLLSQREELRFYGSHFFRSPVLCILNEVEQMKTENKMQYVSLVLLMANQNKLSEENLENEDSGMNMFSEIKYEVLKKCKVKNTTDTFEFIDALSEMEGTYTKKCDNGFTFEHDSMFEIIAYHFGSQYPELILRVMSSDYIANYIEIETCTSRKEKKDKSEHKSDTGIARTNTAYMRNGVNDLCIKLKEAHYSTLCKRLVREIKNIGYHKVFMNKTLKHLPVLQEFIGLMGADVNMVRENETPLTAACDLGILNVVEELIKAGADVNQCNGEVTPLTAACDLNHLTLVENLIVAGADVNLRDQMFTPLTLACEKGQLDVVEKLIKGGADVNLFDEYKTPLTIACENSHLNVVVVLIQSGADVNKSDMINTPLTIACEGEQMSAVTQRIEFGIDFNIISESPIPQLVPSKDMYKYHQTIYLGIVHVLINSGADVNLNDGCKTPLTTACEKGQLEIVQELIKYGADVNLRDIYETPLLIACNNGYLSIVKVLIEAGVDVNLSNEYETPLIVACERGYVSIVQELVKEGACVNLDKHCRTPLTTACSNKHLDVVEELIKMGANVNLSGGLYTPLIISCERGELEIVKRLIKFGADVNLRIKNKTPLLAACEQEHFIIVEELIKTGVKTNDASLTLAHKNRIHAIVKKLKKEGTKIVRVNKGYERPLETKMYFETSHHLLSLSKSLDELRKIMKQTDRSFSRPKEFLDRSEVQSARSMKLIGRYIKRNEIYGKCLIPCSTPFL